MADNTLDLLDDLIGKARKLGADAADAIAVDARSRGVSWHEGKLEDVEGSEESDIGLRVLIGQKQAMVSTSDRRPASLNALVERTIDMAKAVPDDDYCGLAPEEYLHTGDDFAELDLFDDTDVSADTLADIARDCEAAALAVEGVATSAGAGASASSYGIALRTSHGFAGAYKGSSFSYSVSAVAGEGTGMERDYEFSSGALFRHTG